MWYWGTWRSSRILWRTSIGSMTPRETADYLGLTLKGLYSRVAMRQLPFSRLGGSLRFRRSELDGLLEETKVEPIVLGR